jgi:predicted transcriptional regulator
MKVKDCMTGDVVTVKRSTPLAELIGVFRNFNFHTIPVVDNEHNLVGLITLEHILKVFQPYSSELMQMLKTVPFLDMERKEDDLLFSDISPEIGILVVVDDLMETSVVTIDEEADILQARSLMKMHNIKRLLVVKEKKLVGIISLFDVILMIFREKGVIQ